LTRAAFVPLLLLSIAAAPPPVGGPLPFLPSVARVRVEAARDRVLVVQEVLLPRGEWRSGDLDLYVAFGAPGAPLAFDAHLLAVADGALEPSPDEAGESIAFERAPRRPPSAHLLLGPSQMSGCVLHVKEPAFRRATAPGRMAALRLRALHGSPAQDPELGREVVVRLGVAGGTPLTLGRIQLASLEPRPRIARASAHLCGPDADPLPLAISVSPPVVRAGGPPPIAPVLSVRHANDDLCIRYWTD
jgi:hypothetical protein